MIAMIFAAGLGTRLKPMTDTMPKALVKVGGRPLLRHVMDKFIASGISEFVINIHHFPDQIINYLKENTPEGASISISDERDALLETGGAIKKAAPLLRGCGHFFIHNVDILSNVDFRSFAREVREEAYATLLVSQRDTQRYFLFNDDMRLVGWTNTTTGEVRSPYMDLDTTKCRKLAFAGIHILSEKILDETDGWPERFPIVDFYLSILDRCPIYGVEARNLDLIDVGKIATLSAAEEFLHRNCLEGPAPGCGRTP